jgi:flagella basal body P-ring formation protein FlgA
MPISLASLLAPTPYRHIQAGFFRAFTGFAIAALLALSSPAVANDAALMQNVQQFLHGRTQALGEEVMIDLRPPSPHLPACVQPEPFLPNPDASPLGRVTVGVRCGQQHRKVRYMQAQVDVIGQYVVAAEDLPRDTRITPDLLRQQSGNLGELSSRTLVREDDVVGNITRRSIRSGSTFQTQDVRAPLMVKRGDAVSVVAKGSGFRVSREGKAMENGSQGEQIRVRFGRREILDARVISDGLLGIDF